MRAHKHWLSVVALTLASFACSPRQPTTTAFVMGAEGAAARARADSIRLPYTQADIDFMSGMIHHHAQAIRISGWAESHGADAEVQRLAARIINAQRDEITLMQNWLIDRHQTPPRPDSKGLMPMSDMAGHEGHEGHGSGTAMMPGMLTDAQLSEVDAARGPDFDRLFLSYMIQHHRGAVIMVKELLSHHGAGQDETVFKFANDVDVDQSTEVRRMISMMLDRGHMPPPPLSSNH